MAGRHSLLAVVLFAVVLHVIAITQTILPAQDGLKFIRIARLFHSQPWTDVVRGSDTHPLYPALIAVAEPVVASFRGRWPRRLAAGGTDRRRFRRRSGCLFPSMPSRGHSSTGGSLAWRRRWRFSCRAPRNWATTH